MFFPIFYLFFNWKKDDFIPNLKPFLCLHSNLNQMGPFLKKYRYACYLSYATLVSSVPLLATNLLQLLWRDILGGIMEKTSRDCKWLPRKHLIGCQDVKLFITKDFFQKLFFWSEFEFSSFVIISVVEFCHNLSCWILSHFEFCQTELNFVPIQVFQFCYNSSWWVVFTT